MKTKTEFFDTVGDLEDITGLSHEELWEAGFDLDDMDWGFVSDEPWDKDLWFRNTGDNGYFMYRILMWMENYCCGYKETFYNGRWYYAIYHS